MDHLENSDNRSRPQTGGDRPAFPWGAFLGGIVLGFGTLLAALAQPVFERLRSLQNDVVVLQRDLEQLVGVREQAFQAGNLLADLTTLKGRSDEARQALTDLQRQQTELLVEGRRSAEVSAALTALARLQSSLLDQHDQTLEASRALGEISRVQQQLRDEQGTLADSADSLAGLAKARQDLVELVELKNQLLREGGDVGAAQTASTELLSLKDGLIQSSADLDAARTVAQQLSTLKSELAVQAGTTGAARDAAAELLDMKQEILEESPDVDAVRGLVNRMILTQRELASHGADGPDAARGLDQLINIKDRVLEQTPALADAVQNIEILSDFRQELDGQIKSLDTMRQTLLQLALLEPTINRVASTIAPIAELVNIRRLSEQDLRNAARSIIDSRATPRVSSNPLPPGRITGRSARESLQIDDELFQFPFDLPSSSRVEELVPVPEPLPVPERE